VLDFLGVGRLFFGMIRIQFSMGINIVQCAPRRTSKSVFGDDMLAETMLAPAGQHVGQPLRIRGGDEDIRHLILATKFHRRAQYLARPHFQMQKYLGALAIEDDVDLFFEARQGDIQPPAFFVAVAPAIRPDRIALVQQSGTLRFVDALDGFEFCHVVVAALKSVIGVAEL
jgi:hypothetical protein